MKEEKDILNNLKRTDNPSVPEGFFESFSDNLMSKIENDSFLTELPKREQPKVPEGYFESFSDQLMSKIESDSLLSKIPKREQPEVPEGFFESFSDNLIGKIESTPVEAKKTKIIPLKIMLAVASIAAVFALFVLTTKNDIAPVIAETEIETSTKEFVESDYDEYLLHLDETSIIDYIVENDLDIDEDSEVNESIYSEIESELDTYYYGL